MCFDAGTPLLLFTMKEYDDTFSQERILLYLCLKRAKLAKARNADHILNRISSGPEYDYHKKIRDKMLKRVKKELTIDNILPPRRTWVNLGQAGRKARGLALTSIERNRLSILATIRKHQANMNQFPYQAKLAAYISLVKKASKSYLFSFSPPVVRPEFKEVDKPSNLPIYRPIASFKLLDANVICFVNRYLTEKLDGVLYENAFAFRGARNIGGKFRAPRHHDAFDKIRRYVMDHPNNPIFVAECDMKKFYDTVNHKVVMEQFRRLIRSNGLRLDVRAVRILRKYLRCYDFRRCVYAKNNDQSYFRKNHVEPGIFEWVVDDLKKSYNGRIPSGVGVPQGGALSGLIANIVLSHADDKVLAGSDADLLYIRYCDDMIIMHTDREKCSQALEAYSKALTELKLFPHRNRNIEYGKDFWKEKTKGPYLFSEEAVPWVGFVGYEINRRGEIRIRKRSLRKEIEKQVEVVQSVKAAIKGNRSKIGRHEIYESTVKKLLGMSIGRIELWNYESGDNDMCWVNGFKALNKNRYSEQQVKHLDRCRGRQISKLRAFLADCGDNKVDGDAKKTNYPIKYRGKPFSYYYQTFKKKVGYD